MITVLSTSYLQSNVQRHLDFSAIFFRFRTKLPLHIIFTVDVCDILLTGLILCSGPGRLPWVGEYRLSDKTVRKMLFTIEGNGRKFHCITLYVAT
jgi:hypothetical protein